VIVIIAERLPKRIGDLEIQIKYKNNHEVSVYIIKSITEKA
jgi:hypothetical protein